MNVVEMLLVFLIPALTLAFTLRFKGFMAVLLVAPAAMLLVAVFMLNADPSILLLEPAPGNSSSSTFTESIEERIFQTSTQTVILNNTALYHYNVGAGTTAEQIRNVALSDIAVGEEINGASSVLIGKKIQCVDIQLRKVGSPTGTITVGTFSNVVSTTAIQTFGTIDASALTTSYLYYTFCTTEGAEVTAILTNVFGATYSNGNAGNYVEAQRTTSDVFDGGATRFAEVLFGTTVWTGSSSQDLNARLYDNIPGTASVTTYTYEPSPGTNSTTTTTTTGGSGQTDYTISPETMTVINYMAMVVAGVLGFVMFRRITKPNNSETSD